MEQPKHRRAQGFPRFEHKLVIPGVAGGLLAAAVLVRGFLSTPLRVAEPLTYVAAAIAIVVALLAGLPSARRAASVQPIVAMRSE
jgi:ABC-type antimicrobial peptide transport system permease subunit